MLKGHDGVSLLGAVGMGFCPVLATIALASIGMSAFVPVWMWLSGALLITGLVMLGLEYRCHRQLTPIILSVGGSFLLWVGRYSPIGGTGWEGWPIWGAGGVAVLAAFVLNVRARSRICVVKPAKPSQSI
jgi:hypothetical protein